MKLAKVAAVLTATSMFSACGLVTKQDDKKEDKADGSSADDGGEDVGDVGDDDATGNNGGNNGGGEDTGHDDDDHSDPNVVYNTSHLVEVQKKAVQRFERLGLTQGASVEMIKTWIEPGWVWARLTYKSGDGAEATKDILIACHSHGDLMGCHRREEAGPLEPIDIPDDGGEEEGDGGDDLPPIDDELPPIDDL